MKKFLCVLMTALFLAVPVYANDEINVINDNIGIDIIGNVETEDFECEDLDISQAENTKVYDMYSTVTTPKFYSQLPDEGKAFYNKFAANIEDTMNGTYEVYLDYTLNVGTGLTFDEALALAKNKAYYAVLRSIFAFNYDNPQFFWYDINKTSIKTGWNETTSYDSQTGTFFIRMGMGVGTNYTNYYRDGYDNQALVESDFAKVESAKTEIIGGLNKNDTDFAKVKYFNDWLCDHNIYNENESSAFTTDIPYVITGAMVYGPEGETEKYPVCQSYAYAIKYLCDEEGIPCTVVTSAGHMWNLVRMEGSWYVVDTTWNDNYKDAYSQQGVRDSNLQCYKWLAIGSNRVTAIDQNSAHLKSIQLDFDALDPTTTNFLNNFGFTEYYLLDTNNDCLLNKGDIAKVLKNVNGIGTVTHDPNSDGSIDLKDAVGITKVFMK